MSHGVGSGIKTAIYALASLALLVLLLLYMQGVIGGHKVAPGVQPLPAGADVRSLVTASVERRLLPDYREWPGTVVSRTVARLAPRLLARIAEVRVRVSEAVLEGAVVAVLDSQDLDARAQQARAARAAAEANLDEANSSLARIQAMFQGQAATQQDLDVALARQRAAGANVEQARQAIREVEALLAETEIRAPFAGIVSERLAEPGDMGVPGQPVLVIYDPRWLRLEAAVPETCASRARVDMEVEARIDTIDQALAARIVEIAPHADPQTRTFLVKADLPEHEGLRPGLFGRFREPCGTYEALLIPATSVRRIGQLELVRVVAGEAVETRHVRTGRRHDDEVEVTSGLREGERVVVGREG